MVNQIRYLVISTTLFSLSYPLGLQKFAHADGGAGASSLIVLSSNDWLCDPTQILNSNEPGYNSHGKGMRNVAIGEKGVVLWNYEPDYRTCDWKSLPRNVWTGPRVDRVEVQSVSYNALVRKDGTVLGWLNNGKASFVPKDLRFSDRTKVVTSPNGVCFLDKAPADPKLRCFKTSWDVLRVWSEFEVPVVQNAEDIVGGYFGFCVSSDEGVTCFDGDKLNRQLTLDQRPSEMKVSARLSSFGEELHLQFPNDDGSTTEGEIAIGGYFGQGQDSNWDPKPAWNSVVYGLSNATVVYRNNYRCLDLALPVTIACHFEGLRLVCPASTPMGETVDLVNQALQVAINPSGR